MRIALTVIALIAFAANSLLCRMALREGAIDKVHDGTTSLREINKVTFVE